MRFESPGDFVRILAAGAPSPRHALAKVSESQQQQITADVDAELQPYVDSIRNEFCERCGSAITWTLEKFPGVRAIAGGGFDDPDWFDIERHIWTRSARKDACFPDGMPPFEQAAPAP